MEMTSESRVGEIAARFPLATRVFARHGIDFCCGGGAPLHQACERRGLDTAAILAEIARTLAAPEADAAAVRWDEAPVAELVSHIVEHFHVPLREELPRLEWMAQKVVRVHGDKDPEGLGALLASFLHLRAELDTHLNEEEQTLFPAILRGASDSAVKIAPFVDDHSRVGRELGRIRELTDNFRVPEGACNTWTALWHGLAALETELHEHIHLENNLLFPRAAAG